MAAGAGTVAVLAADRCRRQPLRLDGVLAGASIVFFAFIGFDIVATTAEETKNPQRDVPRGILGSLAIVTVLYMAVAWSSPGMVQLHRAATPGTPAPLATAFDANGVEWMGNLIAVGACIGLTIVVMVLMLGQTRVGSRWPATGCCRAAWPRCTRSSARPCLITRSPACVVAIIGVGVPMATLGTWSTSAPCSRSSWCQRRRGRAAPHPPRPARAFRAPGVPLLPTCRSLLCV